MAPLDASRVLGEDEDQASDVSSGECALKGDKVIKIGPSLLLPRDEGMYSSFVRPYQLWCSSKSISQG